MEDRYPTSSGEDSGKTFARAEPLEHSRCGIRFGRSDLADGQGLLECAPDPGQMLAERHYHRHEADLSKDGRSVNNAKVGSLLKNNYQDLEPRTLTFSEPDDASYRQQIDHWPAYFLEPSGDAGLPGAVAILVVGVLPLTIAAGTTYRYLRVQAVDQC